jgi:hypothetical protein
MEILANPGFIKFSHLNHMKLFNHVVITCVLISACSTDNPTGVKDSLNKEHSLAEELGVFYDVSSLPEYRDGTISAQVSTYDTTWKNDDGFSGRYSYLRRNADSSLVIFDMKGGGVINRIWTPTPTQDTLDFFIDNDLKPAFSLAYKDLFLGNKFPFIAPLCGNQLGGFYCYLPIPFEKSCMIVSRGKKMQFHQIQYRLYEKGARIKSFNINLNEEEKEAIRKIAILWNKEKKSVHDFFTGELACSSGQFEIKPGKALTVFETDKGGRILGIEAGPSSTFEGLSKSIYIKVTWDGEENPAVFCPLADFFGYAFGKASMQSLLLGSQNNNNYCYFPMPFDKTAKIELVYSHSESIEENPVNIKVQVWYSTHKRIPELEGKFHICWNKILKSQPGRPHVFLNARGKGHYVGTLLQAQGLKAGMTYFFEGDDSTSIDGSFRMHGTGSEDYFNGGWYAMMDRWDGKMSLPIHGSLGYSLPFCHTGGYRFYLSDKLTFEKSFYQSIEHGPVGNLFPVEYTSLGLYYSDTPVTEILKPSDELSKVFLPDTLIIYPQLMNYNLFGNMGVTTTWKYGTGGESYRFEPGIDSWLRISLKEIPQGKYSLFFDVMKEPDGCDFSLWQRQKPISDWLSTYNVTEARAEALYVCDIEIPETESTITIRFRSDKMKSSLLLNRIILIGK